MLFRNVSSRVERRWRRRVRSILNAIGLISSIAAAALLLRIFLAQERSVPAARQQVLAEAARNTARALDQEIRRQRDLLESLAASPLLTRPISNLQDLDTNARAISEMIGSPVTISDVSLAQLVNTSYEFGTPLPSLPMTSVALVALESGESSIRSEMLEKNGQLYTAVIAVPVRRGASSIAVLSTEIEIAGLARLIEGMTMGASAMALLGQNGQVLATSPALLYSEPLMPAQGTNLSSGYDAKEATNASFAQHMFETLNTVPGWKVIAVDIPDDSQNGTMISWEFFGLIVVVFIIVLLNIISIRHFSAQENLKCGVLAEVPALVGASDAKIPRMLIELKALHDTIPVGLALLGTDLRFRSVNAKLAGLAGIPEAEHYGRRPSDVFPPSISEAMEDAHHSVLTTSQPALEVPMSGDAFGAVRNQRHFLANFHPVYGQDGLIAGVGIIVQDVTEHIRAKQGRELLVQELNHRVKNILSTVQSVIVVTLRKNGAGLQQTSKELVSRLRALARAHDLLTSHSWETADLTEAVGAALNPWLLGATPRLTLQGVPGVCLRPLQAQAIILALHELATNAAKYGAFSGEDGRVELHWHTDSDGQTALEWIEVGGPMVTEPRRDGQGFGMRLLERALAADLGSGSKVNLDFRRDGLHARIFFFGARRTTGQLAA
jgi:two-component sensor histidine kinase